MEGHSKFILIYPIDLGSQFLSFLSQQRENETMFVLDLAKTITHFLAPDMFFMYPRQDGRDDGAKSEDLGERLW